MQVRTGGQISGIADQRDRGACTYLVSYLLGQLLIVLVNGNDVTFVLDLYRMSGFFAPSDKHDGTVKNGLDHRSRRRRDVYVRVHRCVIAL